MSDYKTESKNSVSQNPFELANVKLPYPLCVIEDGYFKRHSGSYIYAFDMAPQYVDQLSFDEEGSFERFCEKYCVGIGETAEEAVWDLMMKLKEDEKGEQ